MINLNTKKAIAVLVGTEALGIIESGDPELFIIEVDGRDVEAVNFWYRGQECDLYLIDPYMVRQVEADKTFHKFQHLIKEINNGQAELAA